MIDAESFRTSTQEQAHATFGATAVEAAIPPVVSVIAATIRPVQRVMGKLCTADAASVTARTDFRQKTCV
ncbi:Uncharacterised protein [Mycobacteroides abscessus subsp. abscessus]|nr:Uncharacterised protein [Mycobacteroides abscessus subsp. abscessus]